MLEKTEVEAIARAVVKEVQDSKHAFWIEPEDHYKDHLAMRDMHETFSGVKGIFFKAFLGLVVLGSIIISAVGMGFGKVIGK